MGADVIFDKLQNFKEREAFETYFVDRQCNYSDGHTNILNSTLN